jgi:phenylacetate-CoA ligase
VIWNIEAETMPRADIEAWQGQELALLADRLYTLVPFYKKAFDATGIKPDAIRGLDYLTALPFTTKNDLRDTYPFGLFAVPREKVVRIHASSGTTGKPTVVGYTRSDIALWAELCARSLAAAGAEPGDVFQNAYGYGLFTGGLGMHYGGETMGLSVVPISGGNTARQLLLMQDFGTQIYACTPSYALTIADAIAMANIERDSLKIRSFVLGAEPWTEVMRNEIEAKLNVHAINVYGLSEIIGPGVSCECVEAKDGAHVFEDAFIVEVIDGDGNPVPDGTEGELVFTTLTKEAFPLIRYRTGDIASINREPCICGRTITRMSRVVGRVDDMLIIRGVNVYPSQIEAVLEGMAEVAPHYQLIVTRPQRLDELEVQIEVTPDCFAALGAERLSNPEDDFTRILCTTLRHRIYSILGVTTHVTLLAPNTAVRSEGGKIKRVFDKR